MTQHSPPQPSGDPCETTSPCDADPCDASPYDTAAYGTAAYGTAAYGTAPYEVAPYDVAVIGAGVVGSAIARELAGYELRVALLDAQDDVGNGTSKANTAILHTGFDATPGTLESRLVRRGYTLLSRYAQDTGIPVERTGALLVAWTDEQLERLPGLREKAEKNGYTDCVPVSAEEVYRRVPSLGPGALGGLTVPDESVICPWTTVLAFATDAQARGADVLLGYGVTGVDVGGGDGVTVLSTSRGDVRARWVVNAAGLAADGLDRLFGHDRFTVVPRRGELLVYDKFARELVDCIVLPVPTARGKGVLISPTIYGNVMLGPTAEDLDDPGDTGTSAPGFDFLLSHGARLMPRLLEEEVTASYAGVRAATGQSDYLIAADPQRRYLVAGGIRSTGLSASLAIAEHVGAQLADAGLKMTPRSALPGPPRMPDLGETGTRPYEDDALIAADSAYGRVVCFCERVTEGEIRDACAAPLPPAGLDGLRRRTRATNGRCQGFYCGARVEALLDAVRADGAEGAEGAERPQRSARAGSADGANGAERSARAESGAGVEGGARAERALSVDGAGGAARPERSVRAGSGDRARPAARADGADGAERADSPGRSGRPASADRPDPETPA